ncbi:hypothetical protein [Bifidobacterium longum]|uniref:hypothetical protein n=1 Tax=Bifidobacterium longum TaxID=216816 RepID=UPI0020252E26|nr:MULTISPECIES: hypothetical protein [Bifidobacterium]
MGKRAIWSILILIAVCICIVQTYIPWLRVGVSKAIIIVFFVSMVYSLIAGLIAMGFSEPIQPLTEKYLLVKRLTLFGKWAIGLASFFLSGFLGYLISESLDAVTTVQEGIRVAEQMTGAVYGWLELISFTWCGLLVIDLIRINLNHGLQVGYDHFLDTLFKVKDTEHVGSNSSDASIQLHEKSPIVLILHQACRRMLRPLAENPAFFIFFFSVSLLWAWGELFQWGYASMQAFFMKLWSSQQ